MCADFGLLLLGYPDVTDPVQSFVYCAFFPGIGLAIDCAFLIGDGFSLPMCSFVSGPLSIFHDRDSAQLSRLPAARHPRRDLRSIHGNLAAHPEVFLLRFLAAPGHVESLHHGLPAMCALQPAAQLPVPLWRRSDLQAQGDRLECTSNAHFFCIYFCLF